VRGTPHVTERKGLMLAVDLEQYDYDPGAASLIRASEQTIVDRIPPRVKIRRGAPVEIPHVLVLIDDPTDRLFGGLQRAELNQLYQTQLMLGGGNVAGYELGESDHRHVADALESLLEASTAEKPFLFAVGDGNHSLATAKAVWEEVKSSAEPGSPARYALVEVVNLYDPGLRFEPIHRLVTFRNDAGSMLDWVHELSQEIGSMRETSSQAVVRSALDAETNVVGYVSAQENGIIHLADESALAVAILQSALDERADVEVDYIHGWDTSVQLGSRPGSAAFLLPQFDPHQLFPTVENRGVLPRKAFSLGDAEEKRYYLEARRILES
jgi:hypothetical protein